MTPAASPPDSPHPRRLLAGASLAAALLAAVAVALSGGGCSKPPTTATGTPDDAPKGDPWQTASLRLKKQTDLLTTKTALAGLTADVGAREGAKLPALSDEALAALAALVPLSPADREEIRAGAFSPFDPAYLADCFYLRDAARSLALAGLPPEHQADLAFAWVCRQVYLQPWVRQVPEGFEPTALPPTAVLRRGYGSGLERMYVFLALLQQLELDGCLVGPPDAGALRARQSGPPLKYPYLPRFTVPRGPFWAVGVRVGNDVRLFDPWRGAAVPATLNQLRANPDALKGWFEDKANLSGATPDDAKKATAFLAVPVSALSPRMAAFEARLKGELGVKVAFDQKALEAKRAAFPDPKPAFWNPPDDPFAYGRAARSYLPTELGGADPTPEPGARLYEASLRDQIHIPPKALEVPGLRDAAADRLVNAARNRLALAFVEPPNPRERIQRGQFQDAARDVVARQEEFAAGLDRLRGADAIQQMNEWIERANQLYDALGAARLDRDRPREAEAQAALDAHWRQGGALLIVDRASAEVGRAEAALLLALCKHEQAERLQTRLERAGPDPGRLRADALDAWKTAHAAWLTYEQLAAAQSAFPGRAAHARTLAARAAGFAEPEPKK
jgi:hypothetical protein